VRQKLPQDWHKRLQAIQAKVAEAVKELPADVLMQVCWVPVCVCVCGVLLPISRVGWHGDGLRANAGASAHTGNAMCVRAARHRRYRWLAAPRRRWTISGPCRCATRWRPPASAACLAGSRARLARGTRSSRPTRTEVRRQSGVAALRRHAGGVSGVARGALQSLRARAWVCRAALCWGFRRSSC
jgi:hypothetical protein